MSNAPHFEIDMAAFWADPYPDLARMRKQAPIAFVPQLGSTVITRRDDIFTQEKRIDVFSSHQPAGLMNTLMGHNMMRKDGEAHMSERAAMFPSVSPRTVRDTWRRQFQAHADRILDELAPVFEVIRPEAGWERTTLGSLPKLGVVAVWPLDQEEIEQDATLLVSA